MSGLMAWFSNHYTCARCSHEWTDEWSCMCDDDCPYCGARHMSPFDSNDLSTVIEESNGRFVVLWSPETAEHDPDYRELARFPTREKAEAFLAMD
jgi:DNA-directed RNA polymerase subunit RPC12/RpoP